MVKNKEVSDENEHFPLILEIQDPATLGLNSHKATVR